MTRFLLGFFSFGWLRGLDFLPPLLLRLLLAPILWVSGGEKIGLFSGTEIVLNNPQSWVDMNAYMSTVDALKSSQVSLPFPELLGWLIPGVEIIGAILLLLGLAVRWISIPLLLLAVATLVSVSVGSDTGSVVENFLTTHGYSDPATQPLAQALTYFIMFLTLFFMGAGRYFSLDWLLYRKLQRRVQRLREANVVLKNDPFAVNATTT